jgi:hypothetical protein
LRIYGTWSQDRHTGRAFIVREVYDHIFPRRFLLKFGLNPNQVWNLCSICRQCHPMKLKAEERLYFADTMGWIRELNCMNYPLAMVKLAAGCYGAFQEIVKQIP